MFFSLSPELISLVEAYHEVPYWKQRFSQDVIPLLDKGWRLVGSAGDKCHICYIDDNCHRRKTAAERIWMSRADYEEILLELAALEAARPTLEEMEAIWAISDANYENYFDLLDYDD